MRVCVHVLIVLQKTDNWIKKSVTYFRSASGQSFFRAAMCDVVS